MHPWQKKKTPECITFSYPCKLLYGIKITFNKSFLIRASVVKIRQNRNCNTVRQLTDSTVQLLYSFIIRASVVGGQGGVSVYSSGILQQREKMLYRELLRD